MGENTKNNNDNSISQNTANEQDYLRVSKVYRQCLPIVLFLLVIISSVAFFELYLLYETENQTTKLVKNRVQAKAFDASNKLSLYLAKLPPLVIDLAAQAKHSKYSEGSLNKSLESIMRQNNELFEVGLAYQPSKTKRRNSPHYGVIAEKLKHFELTYDYTEKDWYKTTLDGDPNWFEPYYGQTTHTKVVGYAVPFTRTVDGITQSGVARANFSLNGIRRHLNRMDLGEDGYTFILSAKQNFIYHPIPRYTAESLNLNDLQASPDENGFFQDLEQLMKKKPSGIALLDDPMTKKSSWVVFTPITESGWTLVSVNIEEDLINDTFKESHTHKIKSLILLTISVLLFWLYLGMKVRSRKGMDTAWLTSLAFSLTLVISLIVMSRYFQDYENAQSLRTITNIQELNEITKKQQLQKNTGKQAPVKVPTGVFIQSIEFHSSNNVFITGYVWQKTLTGKITPGIIFPEAVSGSELTEVFSKKIGKETLTGWYFETVFRQPFDYSRYPLDNKDVWIRMWHGNFEENVILVPDLSAYNVSAAELTPGMEESIVLSGWNLQASGFQYVKHNYNSSFGFAPNVHLDNFAELYYTVRLERNFIDAFVTNLVPLIVVSIMLFAILLTITNDPKKAGLFGADAFSVVTSTAGLFFIVLVAHIQLRKEFTLPNIIYMEYFYLVMYVAILWVSVSAFLVTSSKQGQLMHYRDGLFAKIFYWPMILVALMFISYNVFI